MNERIKDLAFKTGFISKRTNGDEWRWGYIDPELSAKLEKFAELIVRECALQCVHNEDMDLIEKHFGVEK